MEADPRAQAAHKGILLQMVVDMQPLLFVNNKGFLMDKRLTVPELKNHNPEWYKYKIEKVCQCLLIRSNVLWWLWGRIGNSLSLP